MGAKYYVLSLPIETETHSPKLLVFDNGMLELGACCQGHVRNSQKSICSHTLSAY